MNSAESFSADYTEAREKFLRAAAAAGGALESLAHPERGPGGAALHCDVAWFGPRTAERVLVLISGTHGIEGFCGSGVQTDWLRRGEAARLPHGVAALVIHAINPYGFAWLRRVTEDNVDLNRNWIDFSRGLPENPAYDELAGIVTPAEWSPESIARMLTTLGSIGARDGAAALQRALSGGQYRHPHGIFYGGAGPTWSRRSQTAIFAQYLGRAAHIAILDFHTGLGPHGFGEQITAEPRESTSFKRAASWFGAALTSVLDGSSSSSAISGDGLSAAPTLLAQAKVTGIALEFGTQPLNEVILALCADAWLHAHGEMSAPLGRSIKAQMRAAFYADADDWKGMVTGQSLIACRQAIAGLLRG